MRQGICVHLNDEGSRYFLCVLKKASFMKTPITINGMQFAMVNCKWLEWGDDVWESERLKIPLLYILIKHGARGAESVLGYARPRFWPWIAGKKP